MVATFDYHYDCIAVQKTWTFHNEISKVPCALRVLFDPDLGTRRAALFHMCFRDRPENHTSDVYCRSELVEVRITAAPPNR